MIAKETGDLQNDSKLRRGLEVPKYNVFRHFSFQMDKQRSRINALWNSWLCIGIHPVMGLLNNPGGGGTLYGVSEPQHTDSMF